MSEPEYIEAGEEFESYGQRRKWQIGQTDWELRVLILFGRKYFKDQKEGHAIREIQKGMLSFYVNPFRPPKYPTEFIEELMDWVKEKRARGELVQMEGFISACRNQARRQEWCERKLEEWKKSHPTHDLPVVIKKAEVHRGPKTQYTDSLD